MVRNHMGRWVSAFRVKGLACVVAFLCVCVIAQMLGAPFTLLNLMNEDMFTESEPVSEDFALTPSHEPAKTRLFRLFTEFRSTLNLSVFLTSVFRPPLL